MGVYLDVSVTETPEDLLQRLRAQAAESVTARENYVRDVRASCDMQIADAEAELADARARAANFDALAVAETV